MNVVLLASRRTPMPTGPDGYLYLSRNVVSVEFEWNPSCVGRLALWHGGQHCDTQLTMRRFATPRLEFDGTLGGIDDKEEEQE
jgi:hypothetical protein